MAEYGWVDDEPEATYGWVDDEPEIKSTIAEKFAGYANALAKGAGEGVIDGIKSVGYGTEKILAGPARLASELAGSDSGVKAVDDFMSSETAKADAVEERSPIVSALGRTTPLVAGGIGMSVASKLPSLLSAIAGSAVERGVEYDTSGAPRGEGVSGRVQDFVGDAAEGALYGTAGYAGGKGLSALATGTGKVLSNQIDKLGGTKITDLMTESYQRAITAGKELGYKLSPGEKLQREGSGFLEEGAKNSVRRHNQKVSNKIAGEALGYDNVTSLDRGTRSEFMDEIKKGLNSIDDMEFDYDINLFDDIAEAHGKYIGSITRGDGDDMTKIVNRLYDKFDDGPLSGKSYNAIRDELSKDLRSGSKSHPYKQSAGKLISSLDDLIDRGMQRQSSPSSIATLLKARKDYGIMLDVNKSVKGENIDLGKMADLLKKKKGITGYGKADDNLTAASDLHKLLTEQSEASSISRFLPTSTTPGLIERSLAGTAGMVSPSYMKAGEAGIRFTNEMSPYSKEPIRRLMGLMGAGLLNDPEEFNR